MAFSYSGDPTESQVDLLRFTLGDTDESAPLMQDAEYEYLISQYPNASDQNKLIAAAFRAGATHLAMKNVIVWVPSLKPHASGQPILPPWPISMKISLCSQALRLCLTMTLIRFSTKA